MPTGTESQEHYLANGKTTIIHRDGNHQYWVGDATEKMPSVTSMLGPLDLKFRVGMGYAIKQIRLNNNDLNAPYRVTKKAQDEGTRLHEAIHDYISKGIVDETYDLFVLWLNEVGNHSEWVASEKFLFHPTYKFGGTADAFSTYAIHDWKTVNQDSYASYGGLIKDQAQLGAYAMALEAMGSTLARSTGYITYIMRDGSGTDTIEVDLGKAWTLFKACRHLDSTVRRIMYNEPLGWESTCCDAPIVGEVDHDQTDTGEGETAIVSFGICSECHQNNAVTPIYEEAENVKV